ncbi:MAG: hypothetical protein GY812_16890, partial [Actinomycetia bacterium]|nr:hypothetical protein [Actinomycetes bacterium]
MEAIGWLQSVIVNKTTGHLVDGHLRVKMDARRREPTVPVTYVEISEAEEKAAPPVRETRRKVSLWLLAGLVLAAVGYATPAFVAEPDWDRSDEFADVAQFDRLHPVPGFGWSGSSAVDTTGWAAAERQQVCSEIMHGLPGDGSLLLSTADGYAVMCQAAPLVQTAEVSP